MPGRRSGRSPTPCKTSCPRGGQETRDQWRIRSPDEALTRSDGDGTSDGTARPRSRHTARARAPGDPQRPGRQVDGRRPGKAAARDPSGRRSARRREAPRDERTPKRVASGLSLSLSPRRGPELSPREEDVVRLLIAGATTKGIASALFLSEHTVRTHIKHCMQKLGVTCRAAIVARLLGASRVVTVEDRLARPLSHAAIVARFLGASRGQT
ncbi:MAG: hypothetical protein HY775_08110 [Acidobacteria bacterium]|nr:hypothetical protein [Acidobacteriota bacterium]